ncbi:MAG: hypothetical protein U5R06_22895 [candidate division KSB1 bacterium]|nr:hypothetical protein [candidate division KSB1 bacterium]
MQCSIRDAAEQAWPVGELLPSDAVLSFLSPGAMSAFRLIDAGAVCGRGKTGIATTFFLQLPEISLNYVMFIIKRRVQWQNW